MVRFNPQVVVIDASGENATLVRDFTLTYSVSSADALTINDSLGTVTIDETLTQNIVVRLTNDIIIILGHHSVCLTPA